MRATYKRRKCCSSPPHCEPHLPLQLEHPAFHVLPLRVDRFNELELLPLGRHHVRDEEIPIEHYLRAVKREGVNRRASPRKQAKKNCAVAAYNNEIPPRTRTYGGTSYIHGARTHETR